MKVNINESYVDEKTGEVFPASPFGVIEETGEPVLVIKATDLHSVESARRIVSMRIATANKSEHANRLSYELAVFEEDVFAFRKKPKNKPEKAELPTRKGFLEEQEKTAKERIKSILKDASEEARQYPETPGEAQEQRDPLDGVDVPTDKGEAQEYRVPSPDDNVPVDKGETEEEE